MCLIVHRPTDRAIPSEWIENAMVHNPDGWGIMASDGKKLQITRGMSKKGFSRALKKYKDQEIFIHFRNATHGTIGVENCHPFTIVNDQFAIMHNGVINVDTSLCSDRSDTWHYANRFLAPLLEQDRSALSDPRFPETIGKHVGIGNKLIILRADGTHVIVNKDQGTNLKGCWLSNDYSINSPLRRWQSIYSIEDLSSLERDELIELCLDDPEAIADAILDIAWTNMSFRDYR